MGMDVFGKNPTTEEGKYFRNNVWWWRPLADYCREVAPDECAACEHWQSNDGDGLDGGGARKLADKLDEEIKSGRARAYEKRFTSAQEMTPDKSCDLCEGTGTRKPIPERGAGDLKTGIRCNACNGTGHVRPWSTEYPVLRRQCAEVRHLPARVRGIRDMLKKLLLFIGDALDHLLYVLGPTVRWMLWGVAIALVILMYLETR